MKQDFMISGLMARRGWPGLAFLTSKAKTFPRRAREVSLSSALCSLRVRGVRRRGRDSFPVPTRRGGRNGAMGSDSPADSAAPKKSRRSGAIFEEVIDFGVGAAAARTDCRDHFDSDSVVREAVPIRSLGPNDGEPESWWPPIELTMNLRADERLLF
jgi:hypothetical protein